MTRQRGSALLMILMMLGVAAAYLFVTALTGTRDKLERDEVTAKALAQAKEALIGFAATYRDRPGHADQVFGYLPCPDTNNDGNAEPVCGGADVSVVGKLPWRTLGLPPPRDSAAECLWYAVSGHGKDNPATAMLNWDTIGQFALRDAGGTTLTPGGVHSTPLAVVYAPRGALAGQTRPNTGNECGGNNTLAAYLEGAAVLPAANATSTLTLANAASIAAGTNNDAALSITPQEIFARIRQRSDFKTDIDTMLNDLESCLSLAVHVAAGNKGIANIYPPPLPPTPASVCQATYGGWPVLKQRFLDNWNDNLLYARPGGSITVNTDSSCQAVLIFGGSRSATQDRASAASRLLAANYLEGVNLASFPGGANYSGATVFDPANPTADLVRCIKPGSMSLSFAGNFGGFVPAGVGVTPNVGAKTVTIAGAGGASGGCFWYPSTIPLAGKTLRAYYDYQFTQADPVGGSDRGNGFTLSLLRGDFLPPIPCGTQNDMGALDPASSWGVKSFIVESDVHLDAGTADPVENHTAIMAHGNLTHSPTNGNPTAACNGSAAGCRHSPADTFEESPSPTAHRQRIEIHSGCNAACTVCNPPTHGAPNDYARISAWVDCSGAACSDVGANINRVAQPPTVNRCIQLDVELNTAYAGFTGGFRSGGVQQGVILSGFNLRSE